MARAPSKAPPVQGEETAARAAGARGRGRASSPGAPPADGAPAATAPAATPAATGAPSSKPAPVPQVRRKPASASRRPADGPAPATPPPVTPSLAPPLVPPPADAAAKVGPHPFEAPPLEPRPPEPPTPAGAPVTASPTAQAPPPRTASALAMMSPEQRRAVEALSLNLAKAAITAQGALAEAIVTSNERGAAPDTDPFHVGAAVSEVMGKLALSPETVLRAQADLFTQYLDLWTSAARRAAGEPWNPVVTPGKGDKRFNDPDWTDNPMFDVLKQSYLVTSNWLNGLVSAVETVDPLTKRRVEFFTKMLTDAFSPSNFLISNPAALREAMSSQGQSLLRGAENFAADLQRGGGRLAISQTDASRFKVGENVATAPGKVVARNELFELLQFTPTTPQVAEIPLLIFPPWINKYYILDLRPENSMIRWLVSQGLTVFVTSWVNPDASLAEKTLEDYLYGGIYTAVEQVMTQTGAPRVNTVGYCIGGTLLSCALAHMAAKGDKRIASATFFAAQQDFTEAGDLLLFTDDDWLRDLETRIDAAGGVSPAGAMADTFNALRANDLIWSFFVNNYLLGREPAAFDLLFWNSDQTRMPKALHLSYIKDFYRANRLSRGDLVLGGERLDLGRVTVPVYVQSSKEDHIAPMRSVYRGARLFGGETRFTLAGSGHIAGVINAPSAKKYQHWTNPDLPPTLEAWMQGAVEAAGSWWPHWRAWLGERSGPKVAARDPASGPLPALEDAPGSYVKVRSAA